MRWCLVFAFVGVTLAAENTQRPRHIREIADSAMAAPPELAADLLLHLIEGGKTPDPKWKRELVETAWSLARHAVFPAPVLYAVTTHTDTNIGFLSAALAPGLTTAGLQLRALTLTDRFDKIRTREMFLEMARPKYDPLDCSSAGYNSNAPYFEAATVVANGFTPKEKAEGKRTTFLLEAVRSATTPQDFQLSLDLLRKETSMDNADFAGLVAVWSANLEQSRFDDRTYGSMPPYSWSSTFFEFARQVQGRGLGTAPLMQAFRNYLTRHEMANRCGEAKTWLQKQEQLRQFFNTTLPALAPGLSPIKQEEISPASIGAKAQVVDYLKNDDQISKIRADYAHLRFGTQEQRSVYELVKRSDHMSPYLTEEQRGTPEWNQEASHFFNTLQSWDGTHGQATKDLFHQKCTWYTAFLSIVPSCELRDQALQSYVKFLAGSLIERESPPEWLLWVNRLIRFPDVKDRSHFLSQIEAAGDTTTTLYARLSRVVDK